MRNDLIGSASSEQGIRNQESLFLRVDFRDLPDHLRRLKRILCGRTDALLTRMNGHRTAIRNGSDRLVADHVGQYGRQPRVCVLSSSPYNTTQRRIVEGQWIARFRKLGSMTVLNRNNGADVLHLYLTLRCQPGTLREPSLGRPTLKRRTHTPNTIILPN